MKTLSNKPAFPDSGRGAYLDKCDFRDQNGLTKREFFAAQAMNVYEPQVGCHGSIEDAIKDSARKAVMYADAVIVELNKTK